MTCINALDGASGGNLSSDESQCSGGLAFMFETVFPLKVVPHALQGSHGWRLDRRYLECWRGLLENDSLPAFTGWEAIAAKKLQEAERCDGKQK
jgi:hypothetical protein